MSFGKAAEPLYRDLSGFKRKPLSEISEGHDDRLEAARLAPSGMNRQNWYFIAENGKIHCYLKKASPLLETMFKKMACIDLGIAICHIASESDNFRFSKETNAPSSKRHIYVGTIH
jgi:nitroreductase